MVHKQQWRLLQLYVLFNFLQSSAQMSNNRTEVKNPTGSTEPRMDQTGDVSKSTEIIRQVNETLTSVNPLSVWLKKDRYATLKTLKINVSKMQSCIQNEENPRLEMVLLKVLKGEAINAVVYGGSNCAQGMFPVLLRDWWNELIMPISGSPLNVKVVGIGGTGSAYYQFCHEIYLEENETVDLVFVESAVNDVLIPIASREDANHSRSLPLEQFTRQLLERRSNPAVFYVNLFKIIEPHYRCSNLVDYGQAPISELYAITTFHFRCLACRLSEGKFYSDLSTHEVHDGWHSNLFGHAQIALMIIHVISKTFGKLAEEANKLPENDLRSFWSVAKAAKILALPSPVYIEGEGSIIRSPKCQANLTPSYNQRLIRNTLSLHVVKNVGFTHVDIVKIGAKSYSAANVAREDAYGGVVANATSSQVTLSFTVPPQRCESAVRTESDYSSVTPQTLSTVSAGTVGILSRYIYNGGTVDAWLDDRYDERVRTRLRNVNSQTTVIVLATRVKSGRHTITMEIVEEGNSALIGVFVGPCDWP